MGNNIFWRDYFGIIFYTYVFLSLIALAYFLIRWGIYHFQEAGIDRPYKKYTLISTGIAVLFLILGIAVAPSGTTKSSASQSDAVSSSKAKKSSATDASKIKASISKANSIKEKESSESALSSSKEESESIAASKSESKEDSESIASSESESSKKQSEAESSSIAKASSESLAASSSSAKKRAKQVLQTMLLIPKMVIGLLPLLVWFLYQTPTSTTPALKTQVITNI